MLNLSLKQLPVRFEFDYFKSFKTKIEKNIRKKLLTSFNVKNNFENCLKNLIIQELPLCF